jgi:predicted regulator of Ras-like GTPase activity (Roadblock/LC7/MglB family)
MDAAAALADLTEISSQVEAAAVVDGEGNVLAATRDGERLAAVGRELLEAAEEEFGGRRSVTKLEVALREGSVFAVRERGLVLVARTSPDPASGLVLYDLGSCLQSIDPPKSARKTRSRAKKAQATADA